MLLLLLFFLGGVTFNSYSAFSHFQANSPESIKENQAPASSDIQNCFTPSSSSIYPCTSTVNPTIVLLQHNRGEHTRLSVLDDAYQEEFPKAFKSVMNKIFL